jgi:hypothetical protein
VICLLLAGALAGVLGAPPGAAAAGTGERQWPLAGPREVGRAFAPPEVRYAAGHRGVDLPSTPGAPVLAAAEGRVTYSGLLAGRGVVVVRHGELRTTYEPVSAAVQVGDVVGAGSVLGRLEAGHLGCAVPACLHWGLKRGEDYLDPVRWVAGGPVRLLPVEGALSGSDPARARPTVPGASDRTGPVGSAAGVPPGPSSGGSALAGEDGGAALRPATAGALPRTAAGGALPPASGALTAPEAEPRWSLRSAEAPLGAAAVAALVAGIGLLARPRSPSPGPATGAAALPVTEPVEDEDSGPPGELVDLDAARARRRSG